MTVAELYRLYKTNVPDRIRVALAKYISRQYRPTRPSQFALVDGNMVVQTLIYRPSNFSPHSDGSPQVEFTESSDRPTLINMSALEDINET